MIRIAKDRCGYVVYECKGVGEISDAIKLNRMVSDDDITRTQFTDSYESETVPPFKYHLIDNYLNIPVLLDDMVTVPDIIQDMSDLDWSPETTCWTNDRLLDLLSNYGNLIVARRDIDDEYHSITDTLFCFNPTYNDKAEITGGKEQAFKPGSMEPMMHVAIPAGPPAPVVSPETSMDGITLAIKNLFSWRCAIEDFLTIYNPPMPDTCGIPQLIMSMNEQSVCDNFKITHLNGVPIAIGADATIDVCTYEVSSGYVTINGRRVDVAGRIFVAPFYAYVNITEDSSGNYHGTMSETSVGLSAAIGGVKLVKSSESSFHCESSTEPTVYQMYVLEQNDCISVVSTISPENITDIVDPMFCSVKDLIIGMNAESVCPNFKITLIAGTPVVTGDSDVVLPACYYSVSSGTISYDGVEYAVDGIPSIRAPFYLYVNLSSDRSMASLSTVKGNFAIGIGGVREVSTRSLSERQTGCADTSDPEFITGKAYVLEQDDCVTPVQTVTPDYIESLIQPRIGGIEDLLIGINAESVCPNFKIELISGTPMAYGESPILPACYYSISGGTIYVDGQQRQVSGIESMLAPFYLYVNVPRDGTIPYLSTTRGDGAIGIGGVREVDSRDQVTSADQDDDNAASSSSSYYKMYVMEQDDCVSVPPTIDRTDIDDYIVPRFCGIEDMIIGINSDTACQNFKISLISGLPLGYGQNAALNACYYSVSDGTVTVNGQEIQVAGIPSIRAPFYVYLNISEDGTSASLSTTKGSNAIGVGGVREVNSRAVIEHSTTCDLEEGETPPTQYRLYVIEQDDCLSAPITPVEHVSVCGIEALLTSIVSDTACENMGITLKSGTPIASWKDDEPEPSLDTCIYHVDGGIININGVQVPVVGGDFQAPFYVYANIDAGDRLSATLSTVPGTKYIGIGGVRIVRSSDVTDTTQPVSQDCENIPGLKAHMNYKMYASEQSDCVTTTTVIQGTEPGNVTWDPGIDALESTYTSPEPGYNPLTVTPDGPSPLCGIRDLLVALNMESPCEMFKITLISGCPISHGPDASLEPCYYEVSDGMVDVNGIINSVPGIAALRAPFDVYLNMNDTGTKMWLSTSYGTNYRWIGSVREVTSKNVEATSKASKECRESKKEESGSYEEYSMYVISQGDCSVISLTPLAVDPVCNMEALITAINSKTVCDNLTITHKSGKSIISWYEGTEEPSLPVNVYTVKAGDITINRQTVHVNQVPAVDENGNYIYQTVNGLQVHVMTDPEFEAPFYAYLHMYVSDGILRANVTTEKTAGCIAIGGVGVIKSSSMGDEGYESNGNMIPGRKARRMLYKMYTVEQASCLDNQFYYDFNSVGIVNYDPETFPGGFGVTPPVSAEIEDLLINLTAESACETQFKIQLVSGRPLVYDTGDPEEPWEMGDCEYKISGGSIEVNGHEYDVEEDTITLNEGVKSVYWYVKLDVNPQEVDNTCMPTNCAKPVEYSARLVREKSENCIGIGGVKFVQTDKYKMFAIEQQECKITQDMLRFDGKGVVWYDDDIDTDAGKLSLGMGCNIEQLLMAMNEETACTVFKIKHVSGVPIAFGNESMQECYYKVSGGTVYVNGAPVTVESRNFKAPFYAYITFDISQDGITAQLATSPSGSSVGVGGVKLVDTDRASSKLCGDQSAKESRYRMYVIEQGECVTTFDAIRTDESGLLYRYAGTSTTPYSVYQITTCDE